MGAESLRIVARHGIGETLDAFEGLYGMVPHPRDHAADRDGAPTIAGVRGGAASGDRRCVPALAGGLRSGSGRQMLLAKPT